MPKFTSPLDQVKIAAPCSAGWDQMFSFEDKRVRFCSQCNLNVYNLSGMSRPTASFIPEICRIEDDYQGGSKPPALSECRCKERCSRFSGIRDQNFTW